MRRVAAVIAIAAILSASTVSASDLEAALKMSNEVKEEKARIFNNRILEKLEAKKKEVTSIAKTILYKDTAEIKKEEIATYKDSEMTPILGKPSITLEQAKKWFARVTKSKSTDLVELYWIIAINEGVRPEVALAQACLESGYFESRACTKLFNPAGIGPNYDMKNLERGVLTHVQLLKSYATPNPKFFYKKQKYTNCGYGNGWSPYIEWLGAEDHPKGKSYCVSGSESYGKKMKDMIGGMRDE